MSNKTEEVDIDDIPISRDYIDDVRGELEYVKGFRHKNIKDKNRIRDQISNLNKNKSENPEEYDKLNQRRCQIYRKMRDMEYELEQLYQESYDIQTKLTTGWTERELEELDE